MKIVAGEREILGPHPLGRARPFLGSGHRPFEPHPFGPTFQGPPDPPTTRPTHRGRDRLWPIPFWPS